MTLKDLRVDKVETEKESFYGSEAGLLQPFRQEILATAACFVTDWDNSRRGTQTRKLIDEEMMSPIVAACSETALMYLCPSRARCVVL